MAPGVRRTAFVGRENELAQLEAALEARAECPGVFVAGEAGIGKTRLLREFAARAVGAGATVTWGGCLETGAEGLPFSPFVEALGRLHEILGDECGWFDAPELAGLVPGLPARSTREPERVRLFEAIRGLFDGVPGPVVLVLEDLHWADRSSLELASYLVRRIRHGHTLIVASLRSDEVVEGHPAAQAIAELVRSGRARRIDLGPLSAEEIARLARAVQQGITGRATAAIVARAEGNPFFAEVLASAAFDGLHEVPISLRDLMLLGVEGLDGPTRHVLDVVAAVGRPVSPILLERVWDGGDDELDGALADALTRGILVREGLSDCVGLRHALAGSAIEERLQPRERARLHERIAHVLVDRKELGAPTEAGRASELAVHWFRARRDPEALAASVTAAHEAERLPAWGEACAHYERALRLWDTVADADALASTDRASVLERAATAAALSGEPQRAVELQRAAIAASDERTGSSALSDRYSWLVRWLDECMDAADMPAAAERAVALLPPDAPGACRAHALWALAGARMQWARYREAAAVATEAADIAATSGAMSLEAGARSVAGLSRWTLGDDAGIDELRRAVLLAQAGEDTHALVVANFNLCYVLARSGDAVAAQAALAEFRNAAERRDVLAGQQEYLDKWEVELLFREGRWDACLNGADELLARGTSRYVGNCVRAVRGRVQVARGRDAEADLDAVLADADRRADDPAWIAAVGLAEAALIRGGPDRALDIIGEAIGFLPDEELRPQVALRVVGLRAAADLAEIGRARRDRDRIERAAKAVARYDPTAALSAMTTRANGLAAARDLCGLAAWGRAEKARAEGRADAAAWEAAGGASRCLGPHAMPYLSWRRAEALLGCGRRAEAADALRDAEAGATVLGLAPLVDEIARLARHGRLELADHAPPAPEPAADPYGLSAREREVLAFLVDGRTNREIGAALFISDKTASVHVTHILNKLGVNSRGAAAALAARAGLDERR